MDLAKKKIGLALSGGGAKGLAHIGVLEMLEQEGLIPDIIVGSSVGAVVGAMYAFEPDIKRLKQKVSDFLSSESFSRKWKNSTNNNSQPKKRFYRGATHFVLRQLVGMKLLNTISLRPETELRDILISLLDGKERFDTKIKFGTVALDVLTGEEKLLTRGGLVDLVYASAAIPGVFPPIEYDTMLLVDGGYSCHCPVNFVRSLGADYVIAVDLSSILKSEDKFEAGIDVISRTNEIVRHKLGGREIRSADLVITPDVADVHWADFSNWEVTIQHGFDAATDKTKQIQRLRKKQSYNLLTRLVTGLSWRR